MHPVVQNKLAALKDLCTRYRVERLDLFGSAAQDDFDPESSDLDFLVEFAPMSPGITRTASSVCSRISSGSSAGASTSWIPSLLGNPYLRASIED